jgi:hypothetical protein
MSENHAHHCPGQLIGDEPGDSCMCGARYVAVRADRDETLDDLLLGLVEAVLDDQDSFGRRLGNRPVTPAMDAIRAYVADQLRAAVNPKVDHVNPEQDRTPWPEWRDMETAPRDGTQVLIFSCTGEMRVAAWSRLGGSWRSPAGGFIEPLYWMPLPPDPTR